MKTFLAFVIAPLFPAMGMCFSDTPSGFYFIYSYVLSALVGLPVYLTLKQKKKESQVMYATLGFLGGVMIVTVINILDLFNFEVLIAALVFGALGAVTAMIFSFIQGNKRPLRGS